MKSKITFSKSMAFFKAQNELIEDIDVSLGGVILLTSAFFPPALAAIEPKNEVLKIAKKIVDGLGQQKPSANPAIRTERIAAGHAILVLTSFVDGSKHVLGDHNWEGMEVSDADLGRIAALTSRGNDACADDIARLNEPLTLHGIPCPSPSEPFEATVEALTDFYRELARAFLRFAQGLSFWQDIVLKSEDPAGHNNLENLAQASTKAYVANFQRMAGEVPEFAFWALSQQIQAIHSDLSDIQARLSIPAPEVGISLQQTQALLTMVYSKLNEPLTGVAAAVAQLNSRTLYKPLLEAGQNDTAGISSPTIDQGYIDPLFKLATYSHGDSPSEESWWRARETRDDIANFLAAHLTSPIATELPLVIMGHPGAGKSMLSKVLCARLPDAFSSLRVELRDVSSNARVDKQIQESLFQQTHERLTWPDFARSAQETLPVIILDGFDELLQATGVSQSDYLEQVAHFQEMEKANGRPVAVLVTSRTTVIDRARIAEDTPMVKLEDFSEAQIQRWVAGWNAANEKYFSNNGLAQLSLERLARNMALASQPILLLMLALYDANDNALGDEEDLGEYRLYQKLLERFVKREVLKTEAAANQDEINRLVENQLYELSIVAIGMYNRDAQFLHADELQQDMDALDLGEKHKPDKPIGALPTADATIGKFFFVYRADAGEGSAGGHATVGRTFEFLHATFGEYLVARLAILLIGEVNVPTGPASPWQRQTQDAGIELLCTLLSFQSFANRLKVVLFLVDGLAHDHVARTSIMRAVPWILSGHRQEAPLAGNDRYTPRRRTLT